ncbi:MAG: hypothetical protein KDI55_08215 [Anaerolineae bacterium]|nr:hypothetical protein [Anaerolineae bacterium]
MTDGTATTVPLAGRFCLRERFVRFQSFQPVFLDVIAPLVSFVEAAFVEGAIELSTSANTQD